MNWIDRLHTLNKNQAIAVLISGGVDSSVALARLKSLGFSNLKAFYLKIWLEDELAHLGVCPWEEDLQYVQAVCQQLAVPLEVVSMQHQYWDRVVSYTIAELKQGFTPSPDLMCNTFIKFGAFIDYLNANPPFTDDFLIASGHYAATLVDPEQGQVVLARSPDPVKDQSYFLSLLSQEQLQRCLFPLADLTKPEVRQLAKDYNLANQSRKDSQGICFLGKIPYSEFVRLQLGEQPGAIREAKTGKVLGRHHGYWFHTIGQRKGLGLGGGPWYVVRKDIVNNEIIVAHPDERLDEDHTCFVVEHQNWMSGLTVEQELRVKLRHGPNDIEILDFASDGQRAMVRLVHADFGIASGQFTVFYQGNICLGGSRVLVDPLTLMNENLKRGETTCLTNYTKSSTLSVSDS